MSLVSNVLTILVRDSGLWVDTLSGVTCVKDLYDLADAAGPIYTKKASIASRGSILVVVSRVLETLGIEGESQLISQ
ncbi:MAG TPA: hypothetical protein VJ255_11255 [Candidatus Acidoferrum sp.]|nr:hypothetical protein [Candidatus Acidoferrum sp.]